MSICGPHEFGWDEADHPATCGLCGQQMPSALVDHHLSIAHGLSLDHLDGDPIFYAPEKP